MPTNPDAVVRAWFKEVWDEGHEDAIDRLADANCIIHGLGGPGAPPMRGTAEFKKLFRIFRQGVGDLEIAVERTVTEGETTAAYCRVRLARRRRAVSRISKQPVEFNGITIAIVRNGKIVEGWNCFDFLSMYQQFGWVKNPPLPGRYEGCYTGIRNTWML